jgi:hypothetical protein
MRGRKEVLWIVAVSAALITAGLVLNCGDDEDSAAAVDCQAACEQYIMCTGDSYFGDTVAECIDACEDELAGAKGDIREGLAEAFACIPDTVCDDIKGECFCKLACQKFADCDFIDEYDNMADCVETCDDDWSIRFIFRCFFALSSCSLIYDCWD